METIKISVNVNVDFSESTQNFVKSIFGMIYPRCECNCGSFDNENQEAEQKPAEQKPAEQKPAEQKPVEQVQEAEQKPAEQKPVEQVQEAEQNEQKPKVTIDLLRELVKNNANEHRDKIKAELLRLGSPSISSLDESKYQELYDFLITL